MVKFPDEKDAVAAVLSIWIVEDMCYWPTPGLDMNKLLKKKIPADFNSWRPCPMILVGKHGNLHLY